MSAPSMQLGFDLFGVAPVAPVAAVAATPPAATPGPAAAPVTLFDLLFHVGDQDVALELPSGERAPLCTRRQWDTLVLPAMRKGFAHNWVLELLGDHGHRGEVARLHALSMAAWRSGRAPGGES